jgi:excisionase family DNA binding protein
VQHPLANQRRVLTPSQVAEMFRVDPKTVTRWAAAGRMPYFKTLGGHKRFYEDEVTPLLKSNSD